jgi:hypothetical protein
MNEDNWTLIAVAILLAIIIFGAFYNANIIHALIDECEQHLPRDKHCHIVGVPDEQ